MLNDVKLIHKAENNMTEWGGGGNLLADFNHCTGCSACMAICPKNAIKMMEDDEGFLSPKIDESLCINCGLCNKVCPILNQHKNPKSPESYALKIKDTQQRIKSSSGGIAYAISKLFIERGAYICGAATEGFYVKHIIINNLNDLHKLQGSKYVQSDMNDCFRRIKKLLIKGQTVLFIGTPCQVAGIKNFCKDVDQRLFTIDLICHGVPSPKVLHSYINELKPEYYTAVTVKFRDKRSGWNDSVSITLLDSEGDTVFHEKQNANPYMKGFLSNVFNRRSCGNCPFACAERVGDMTLGDFWGIESVDRRLNDGKGTSLVLSNSAKGQFMGKAIIDEIEGYPIPMEVPIYFQHNLKEPSPHSPLRDEFFEYFRTGESVIDWLERKLFPVGLLNLQYSDNFGAVLVAYSLSTVLNKLGYPSEIININPTLNPEPNFESFRKKYYKRSAPIYDPRMLKFLNPFYKRIIVGADQVFRITPTETFMLGWTSGDKTLISYSASFGFDIENFQASIPDKVCESLLKRFDFISVREDSGVDICKKRFQVPAVHIIDPTMLLTANDYQKLIDDDEHISIPDKPYIGLMVWDELLKDVRDSKYFQDFASQYELVDCLKYDDSHYRTVGQWLALIKNATYIITESFHCCVFSTLFHKQFIAIPNEGRGNARIPSLLRQLHIPSNRLVNSVNDVSLNSFNDLINFDEVDKTLNLERKKGLDFLKMALNKRPSHKGEVYVIN